MKFISLMNFSKNFSITIKRQKETGTSVSSNNFCLKQQINFLQLPINNMDRGHGLMIQGQIMEQSRLLIKSYSWLYREQSRPRNDFQLDLLINLQKNQSLRQQVKNKQFFLYKIVLEFSIYYKYFQKKYLIIKFQQTFMENLNRYWCHACSKHFQTQKQVSSCTLCQSEAVQFSTGNNNDPSQFTAYQIQNQQQPQNQQNRMEQERNSESSPQNFDAFFPIALSHFQLPMIMRPMRPRIRIVHFINLDENFNPFQQLMAGQNGVLSLLNSLRQQGSLVSTTQQEKNKIQKFEKIKECTVCQQEQCEQQKTGYRLNCGHTFHTDCLDPWLERTNTCPTCRAHV